MVADDATDMRHFLVHPGRMIKTGMVPYLSRLDTQQIEWMAGSRTVDLVRQSMGETPLPDCSHGIGLRGFAFRAFELLPGEPATIGLIGLDVREPHLGSALDATRPDRLVE